MPRLHYLDNLRWLCILLLFPVHASVVFSAGWYGYYVLSGYSSPAALCFIVSVMPWLMPLLFCIAGISAKFALEKRPPAVYLKERVVKLLVPFLAGLVLLCPVLAYFGMKSNLGYTGSFFDAFLHFFGTWNNIRDPTGFTGDFDYGHLWFILWLFVISVAALGLILLSRKIKITPLRPGSVGLPALILLFIPLWLLNRIGDDISGYTLASYFCMFLIGYSLLSMDPVLAKLETYWAVLLAAYAILMLGMIAIGGGVMEGGLTMDELIASPYPVFTGWIGVLALLGAGRHLLDFTNRFAAYLGAASYPVYIIHAPILVAVAFYVVMLKIPPGLQFALIVVLSLLLTFACYEILRRVPGVRVLFGIPGPRTTPASPH